MGLIAGTRYNEHGHADAGMGVDFGDYDRDGDADLFVTNFAFETNALYRNDGQGQFAVATQRLGLADPSYRPLGFGTKFFDYDNDGDFDLFAANGHVIDRIAEVDSSQTYQQPNQIFRNDSGRRFADVSATLGPDFQRANAGRATAVADYDDDGDLDLLVTTVSQPSRDCCATTVVTPSTGYKSCWWERSTPMPSVRGWRWWPTGCAKYRSANRAAAIYPATTRACTSDWALQRAPK